MERKLRFGLVGAGRIGNAYAQAFESARAAQLCAVADVRPEAGQALAHRCGAEYFDRYQNMAHRAKLDAVLICTPPISHPEIAMYFMDENIHVLCEKPFSIDLEHARMMMAASKRNGVAITMASKFRYVDDVIRAKSIVTSGILGEIVLFENAFTSRVDMSAQWNSDPSISGGGVLIDNGTHSVDIMRYFLGMLTDVHVVEGKRTQGLAVEDTVRIFVHSCGGVMGSIDLSWSINKEQESYISIYGSHGTIQVGWKESKYRQSSSPDWVVFGKGYDKVQALRDQLDNFALGIVGDEHFLITAEDALASVEVVQAAYASLRQSHFTSVNGNGQPAARELVGAGRP
ncbi:MAG TPA: Gfo/Idh/MocA family oxidoreductase [Magnetospirillaceae bacterium]|nr:Gfo/Idh/MocA family oxidoreductase [Magnetospirillaceae bacterium]